MFAKTFIGFQTSLGGLPEPFCAYNVFSADLDKFYKFQLKVSIGHVQIFANPLSYN